MDKMDLAWTPSPWMDLVHQNDFLYFPNLSNGSNALFLMGKGRGLLIIQTPSSPIGPKTQVNNFLKAPRKLTIFSFKYK